MILAGVDRGGGGGGGQHGEGGCELENGELHDVVFALFYGVVAQRSISVVGVHPDNNHLFGEDACHSCHCTSSSNCKTPVYNVTHLAR